jgi:hypothetical protein
MEYLSSNIYTFRDLCKGIRAKIEKENGKVRETIHKLHISLRGSSFLNSYGTLLIHHPWPTPMHSHPSPATLNTTKK